MNGNSFVADTNILIYLLDGDTRISEALENKKIFISFISEIELLSSKKLNITELDTIKELLTQCTIVDPNTIIKESTINFRKEYGLKIPDALIAATSYYLNIPLLTSDKDFTSLKELSVAYFEV